MNNSQEAMLYTERPSQLGGRFACLTYHEVGDQTEQYTVTVQQLRIQLAFLQEGRFVVEGIAGRRNERLVSRHAVVRIAVFTIDDGRECTMAAAELLSKHGFNAFFFTRDRCLVKLGYIRVSQIQELRRAGFSVGTHGATHRILTQMPTNTCAADELSESKESLEDILREPVRYMSAPRWVCEQMKRFLVFVNSWIFQAKRQADMRAR